MVVFCSLRRVLQTYTKKQLEDKRVERLNWIKLRQNKDRLEQEVCVVCSEPSHVTCPVTLTGSEPCALQVARSSGRMQGFSKPLSTCHSTAGNSPRLPPSPTQVKFDAFTLSCF